MAVVKVKRTRKRKAAAVKVGKSVRVKVKRDTLKSRASNVVKVTLPAPGAGSGIRAGGATGSSSSSSSAGAGGSSHTTIYPGSYTGVADNTTGNEFKNLRKELAVTFDSLLGDLANTRELDRQFRENVAHIIGQPRVPTVATPEAGVQQNVIAPMDANAAQDNAVMPDPMNMGPVAPAAPAAPAPGGGGGGEPLVDPPPAREDRMAVVGRREAAREQRAQNQRRQAEAAANQVRINDPFDPPAANLQANRNAPPLQGMAGVVGNVVVPENMRFPLQNNEAARFRLPKRGVIDAGRGALVPVNNDLVVDALVNRDQFQQGAAQGNNMMQIYEGGARQGRRAFRRIGEDDNVFDPQPQPQQPELLFDDI
jgi:hypothetical protein